MTDALDTVFAKAKARIPDLSRMTEPEIQAWERGVQARFLTATAGKSSPLLNRVREALAEGDGLTEEQAARELGFRLPDSFVIGDKPADIELGRRCGATTILVRTGYGRESESSAEATPDYVADDLAAASRIVETILRG